jgi:hypothetical protein
MSTQKYISFNLLVPDYVDEGNPIDTFGSSPQEETMDRAQPSIRPIRPRPLEASFVPAPIATDGRATHISGPLARPIDVLPKRKRGCQKIAQNQPKESGMLIEQSD